MISIIVGTNRKGSNSKNIAIQYEQILKERGQTTQLIDLTELPSDFTSTSLYENAGKNETFNVFREKMKQSEKFVFIVPEYNGSFPGVLKAFLDGLEYPDTFLAKKCALIGLSSGSQGGILAMSHLTDIFNYMKMNVLALKPKLSGIDNKIENGKLIDEKYLQLLNEQADSFVNF